MGLRSMTVAVALAATSAALLAGTLWVWPALARRSVATVALRVLMVAALQASTLGLVFVWVNRSYEFYASWSDLLGASSSSARVVAAGRRQPHGGAVRSGAARGTASPGGPRNPARLLSGPSLVRVLSSSVVVVRGEARGQRGRLETVQIRGPVSGITTRAEVYLPPGSSHPAQPLPVVVVISQSPGVGAGRPGPEAASAAAAIAARRMPPAVVAVLPAAVAGRASQGCLDVPGGPQAAAFFTQDLAQALAQAYHVSTLASEWAVVGGPGGGYCALQLADNTAGQFGLAAIRPGAYSEPPGGYGQRSGKASIGVSPQLRNEENMLWRLRHLPPPPVQLLLVGSGRSELAALARPPMRVAIAAPGGGQPPLGPVFGWLGRELGGRA